MYRQRNSLYSNFSKFKTIFFILSLTVSSITGLFAGDAKENFFNAVQHRRSEEFISMLRSGMDINVRGNEGITALIISVRARYNPQIRFLVENGADVNQTDDAGNSAIFYAVENNNREMVLYLIQQGANPNIRNKENQTPLSFAINKGYHEIAILLLKKGSSIFRIDIDHPLSEKYYNTHCEMIDSVKIMDTKISGYPIIKAVADNDYRKVKALLKEGYSPDTSDSMGVSLLMLAASLENSYVGELLIKSGASINKTDHHNRSALAYAAYFGNQRLFSYLLSKQAFIDYAINLEESPLFMAYIADEKEIFSTLVEKTQNPDLQDSLGFTLLSYASYQADLYSLRRILKKNVDVNRDNKFEKPPLVLTMEGFSLRSDNSDYFTVARQLMAAGAKPKKGMVYPSDPEMRNILYDRDY